MDRGTTIINHPDAVVKATNKLTAFKALKAAGVQSPTLPRARKRHSSGLSMMALSLLGRS